MDLFNNYKKPKEGNKENKSDKWEHAINLLLTGQDKDKSSDPFKNFFNQFLCKELTEKYGETVLRVSPEIKKQIRKEKLCSYSLPKAVEVVKTKTPLMAIIKIYLVFQNTIEMNNLEAAILWTHCDNLLTERLNLVRNELLALPLWLNRENFKELAEDCKTLIEELQKAEINYLLQGQSSVYMLPDYLQYGNYETFLQWQESRLNLSDPSDRTEMLQLTQYYPAEAIKIMLNLCKKLYSLAETILPEIEMAELQKYKINPIVYIPKENHKPEANGNKAETQKEINMKTKTIREKTDGIKNRFKFLPGQVLFNNKDLDLPSGEPIEICKKLVKNFNKLVPYKVFDNNYSSAVPGTIPKSVSIIRKHFKNIVPCIIKSNRNEGYIMKEFQAQKSSKKRVRK